MGRAKLVIIAFLMHFLCSCGVFTNKNDTKVYKRSRIKGKISSSDTIRNASVSNGLVYVKIDSVNIKNAKTNIWELKKVNSFLRFFINGRFKDDSTTDFGTGLSDYNNLNKGLKGYYMITDSTIVLERYYATAHDYGKYHVAKLKILGDSIQGYRKLKVRGLTGTPDW